MIYICIALYTLGFFGVLALFNLLVFGPGSEKDRLKVDFIKEDVKYSMDTSGRMAPIYLYCTFLFWPVLIAVGLLLKVKNLFA